MKNNTLLYEDTDLLVVNKPPGLLCVPGLSTPENLFDDIKHYNPNARVVHRLDMATSGIVVFPLNYEAQRHIAKQFERRQINKHYIALVEGELQQNFGEIHSPLICDWPNRPKQKIDWSNGKHSSTFFERLSINTQKNSRVLLKPITGRSHQLRVHMLQIGHPIIGDKLYNQNTEIEQQKRMHLHACKIEFCHPKNGKVLKIESEPEF